MPDPAAFALVAGALVLQHSMLVRVATAEGIWRRVRQSYQNPVVGEALEHTILHAIKRVTTIIPQEALEHTTLHANK